MFEFAESKIAEPDEFFNGEKNSEHIKETLVYMIFNFDLDGDDFFTLPNMLKFFDLMSLVDKLERDDFWRNAKNSKNTNFSGEDIFYLIYKSHKLIEEDNQVSSVGDDSMALGFDF
jgi:hypothetical protein